VEGGARGAEGQGPGAERGRGGTRMNTDRRKILPQVGRLGGGSAPVGCPLLSSRVTRLALFEASYARDHDLRGMPLGEGLSKRHKRHRGGRRHCRDRCDQQRPAGFLTRFQFTSPHGQRRASGSRLFGT